MMAACPRVLGCLCRDVEQHPAGRPPRTRLAPRRLRHGLGAVEVRQGRDKRVRAPGDSDVALQQTGHGLAHRHHELLVPAAGVGALAGCERGGPLDDELGQGVLRRGDVLDEPTDAQGARHRAEPRLVVGEVARGEAQEAPMPLPARKPVGALAVRGARQGVEGGLAHVSRWSVVRAAGLPTTRGFIGARSCPQ